MHQNPKRKRKQQKRIVFFLFFLSVLVLALSIWRIYLKKVNIKQTQKQEVPITMQPHNPTPTATAVKTPSPNPVLTSLKDYPAGEILTPEQIDDKYLSCCFEASSIDDSIKQRIYNKSYRENNDIALEDLRYLKILHYNFDHKIQVGECIVHQKISKDCLEIFTELFKNEYEIQSMYLIDNYWTGDGSSTDTASMNANNSSAFCYRTIAGTSKLSNHALGFAMDINPYQNPYITYRDGMPVYYHTDAQNYADRTQAKPHMITHEDLCYQLFIEHGFTWGGDWKNSKDYQHFEKASQ